MVFPFDRKASTSGPIGRCFIRELPVMIVWSEAADGLTSAQTVARKRAAVPAFCR